MAGKIIIGARLFGVLILLGLLFAGCAEKKEEPKKMQTIANKPLPEEGFRAKITVENAPQTMKMDSKMNVKLKVKNIGNHVWPALSLPEWKYKINVVYRWFDNDNRLVVADGIRTGLPHDVNPNEEITMDAQVAAPTKRGISLLNSA